MPAAAVIPAPIAYVKIAAVKQLVVEFWGACVGRSGVLWMPLHRFACSLWRPVPVWAGFWCGRKVAPASFVPG